MDALPTPVLALLAVVVPIVLFALVDLARHDVRHLPKWGWALVILFGSVPIGAIVYAVVGRVPRGETPRSEGNAIPVSSPVEVRSPATAAVVPPTTDAVVATHGLGKVYGATVALAEVDLAVPRGATYGLIGPNGAGKTTLLSILAGLRHATSGTVEIGVDRRRLAVLVDTPQFDAWLTGREVVDLARHLTAPSTATARVDDVLAEVGLTDAAHRRVGGYSRGMLQRLGLASCLVGDPEVLLLDEPSSALDPAGRREVLDLIGRLAHSRTVVLSTHILSDVQQVCDTVGVIDRGRVRFQGPITDLLARTTSQYLLQVRPPLGDLVQALASRPWASEVTEHAPGRVRLVVSDATAAERDLPRLLAERALALVAFTPATDLETAFLELTR